MYVCRPQSFVLVGCTVLCPLGLSCEIPFVFAAILGWSHRDSPQPPLRLLCDQQPCPGQSPRGAYITSFSYLSLQGCGCRHCVPRRHGPPLGAHLVLYRLHQKGTMAFSTPRHPIVCSFPIPIMTLHPYCRIRSACNACTL